MEHNKELSLFAKSMIAQYSRLIKHQSDEELHRLTSILNMMTLKSGLKLESLKEMSTDNRLIYISVQLWVINLCDALNKEIRMLGLDGVNFLESEKQLESRTLCLKETLTRTIHKHINQMV